MAGAREEYLAAGMDDYLSKPIEPGILFGKLAAVSAVGGTSTTTNDPTAMRDAVLDHAHLASLAMHLPAENVRELLSLFLDQIEAQIAALKALSVGGELAALAREAHTLAGTSGNVGALRLSGFARVIEAASKDADAERVVQLARGLDRVAKEAAAGLRHWLAAEGSPVGADFAAPCRRSARSDRTQAAELK
jgi:HPt (histidine-containing phosphotransfer) domain-containing protein